MRTAAILVLVLAGCGDDAQHHTSFVDAHGSDSGSPDAPAQNGPNLVKLDFFGSPDLIEYRDGHGPWVVPTMASGLYQLHVTDDYQVVAACSFTSLAGNEDSEQLNATFGDGANQFMFCTSGDSAPGTTFAVTGQMLQPGSVDMQDTATGTTSPWSFSLNVAAGTHELVAIGATKMLIRRNLAVSAATSVPDVDVTTAGTAFTPVTATVIGADPTDSVHIQSEWFTGNDFATLSDTTDKTIIYAPDSLIAADDGPQLELQVTNTANTVERSISTYGPSTTTMFTLPPVLTSVTLGTTEPITASWGTLPDYSTADVIAFGGTQTSFLEQHVSATKAWLDKAGATSLAFQSDAAGYDSAWNVPSQGAFIEFDVGNTLQSSSTTTGVISGGAPAVARLHSPLRDHRHARR